MANIDRCFNISELRKAAKKQLPSPIFHYIDGGADDEWTLRRNTSAFEQWEIVPSMLTGVTDVDLSTQLFGQDLALPFIISPTGMSRLFHHHKELGVARAASTVRPGSRSCRCPHAPCSPRRTPPTRGRS